ncbi:MAG: hypothetical protein LBL28_02210 [Treponema sp.]|nr:hypothetical protein [Treponema sp.]
MEISLVIADQGETLEIAGTQENLTIYKAPAKPGSADSLRLRVNTSAYTYAWYVDGVFKTGGPDITINAADYAPGGHTVLLKAEDSKHVPWSKKIFFNVRLIDQEG